MRFRAQSVFRLKAKIQSGYPLKISGAFGMDSHSLVFPIHRRKTFSVYYY